MSFGHQGTRATGVKNFVLCVVCWINSLYDTELASYGYRDKIKSWVIVGKMKLPRMAISDSDSPINLSQLVFFQVTMDLDIVNTRWAALDKVRTAFRIWIKLDRRCTVDLLRLMGTYAKPFCRSCWNKKEKETVLICIVHAQHCVWEKKNVPILCF